MRRGWPKVKENQNASAYFAAAAQQRAQDLAARGLPPEQVFNGMTYSPAVAPLADTGETVQQWAARLDSVPPNEKYNWIVRNPMPTNASTFTSTAPTLPVPLVAPLPSSQETKEIKEAAEAPPQKGMRRAYIPQLGHWITKQEMLKKMSDPGGYSYLYERPSSHFQTPEEREKDKQRAYFALLKQYNLSKHEPTGFPTHPFGGSCGKASDFISGNTGNKGWIYMSPAEKDAFMANEAALKNTPERLAQKQIRKRESQEREYQQLAEKQLTRWRNLSPAERQQETYNKQMQDYVSDQQNYDYANQANMMRQNQQPQFSGEMGGQGISPVMMNELMNYMESQPTRHIPIRPRRSINERVMSSFDPNMFSPEFIPEEQ